MEESVYKNFFEIEEKHWWFVGRQAIVEHFIRRVLHLESGSRILDVGCGTGAVLKSLSASFDVYGTDTSPLAIEYTKGRGLKNVFQCTLENFPRPEIRFDLITMLDVVEHIPDEVGALQQARGLLSPAGSLLLTVPAYQWLWGRHDELNHHQRRYTKKRLLAALRAAGFVVERISYFNTILFPLAVVQRLISRIVPSHEDQMNIPQSLVNSAFEKIFAAEKNILPLFSLPFGLSLIAVARPK